MILSSALENSCHKKYKNWKKISEEGGQLECMIIAVVVAVVVINIIITEPYISSYGIHPACNKIITIIINYYYYYY